MAIVTPFRGIVFNPSKIYDIADVMAPPFDVVSEAERQELHERNPFNSIRLTLGNADPSNPEDHGWVNRSAQYFDQWLNAGILIQDNSPTLYFTARSFFHNNKPITRFGFIALISLEPFENRVVLPHEKTFSNVRSQRLALIKASKANFSPIFSLYSDPENSILVRLKAAVFDKNPDIDFVDHDSQRHRLWRITEHAVQETVSETLKSKQIYIADGHHRYTTALNYRDWLHSQNPDFPKDHPANFVMMYFSCMEDPGVIILPAHRLLRQVPDSIRTTLIPKARKYFDVTTLPYKGKEREKTLIEFASLLKSNSPKTVIGVYMRDHNELYLLTLKPKTMDQLYKDKIPEVLRSIDVTVLNQLIFIDILGFDEDNVEKEKLIGYTSSEAAAVESVDTGVYDIAFVLNPTRHEQVKHIADQGLIMPRKATYFYPKVGSGLVMNRLSPESA
ncbi:MAG: DUF1015 domain-containing protein [Thermodesulfobacteriota bacterium]